MRDLDFDEARGELDTMLGALTVMNEAMTSVYNRHSRDNHKGEDCTEGKVVWAIAHAADSITDARDKISEALDLLSQRHVEVVPRPCPFCGSAPVITPVDPDKDGTCWGSVKCVNKDCWVQPDARDGLNINDDRGSQAYKAKAIARWNTRFAEGSK